MSVIDKLVARSRRRSPWLFRLNAGGCNGCDIEFSACLSPRYDVEQTGALLVGSARHADILCVTGPVTRGSLAALETIFAQMGDPKAVVAVGNCPATCDVFAGSPVIAGPLDGLVPVDVFVPGCPPRPGDIIEGIARAVAALPAKGARGGKRDAKRKRGAGKKT
ncbi:MAG: NADH-quinone oxidoreductase subunit B [Acidobacteriota bacterium]